MIPIRIRKYTQSCLEDELEAQLKAAGLFRGCYKEFKFHPKRKWRADFCWHIFDASSRGIWSFSPLIVEVQGGLFTKGRHTRGKGYEQDCIKYAEAMLLGYRVLLVTAKMIHDGSALHYIEELLK